MRLSQFILSNLKMIIDEWEHFAATLLPEAKLKGLALRNEADKILKAIALDMETAQSSTQQSSPRASRLANGENRRRPLFGQCS